MWSQNRRYAKIANQVFRKTSRTGRITMVVNAEAPNTPAEGVASASAANQLYGATLSQRLTHQVSHQVSC